jgi:Rod binding domain-containing protein
VIPSAGVSSLTPASSPLAALPSSGSWPKTTPARESPAARKLSQAAGEFESMLLANLWKSMKSTFASADDSDDPAHETLEDMGIQAMSSAVGKAGGLGLGKLVIKYLEPILAHSHSGTAAPAAVKASALPADTYLERR